MWSTCAGKTEQAEQFQARHTSRPWICSKRSGRTWRSFGTSRLWHFFANIRRIGLRRWLDAFVAFFSNTLFLFLVWIGFPWLTTLQKHSKATFSGGENQSNKVANFFRKSCPSKQRVVVLEGGFRGWEAHDLPIQQMETTMSQMACDQLALKIGQNVSKVN